MDISPSAINRFRVDRVKSPSVPAGMSSIYHIGPRLDVAQSVFNTLSPGFDPWGAYDPHYGVVLSEWDGNDYRIIDKKGF